MYVRPGTVKVGLHEGVPAARLVSKVDPGVEELANGGHAGYVKIVLVRERVDGIAGSNCADGECMCQGTKVHGR